MKKSKEKTLFERMEPTKREGHLWQALLGVLVVIFFSYSAIDPYLYGTHNVVEGFLLLLEWGFYISAGCGTVFFLCWRMSKL